MIKHHLIAAKVFGAPLMITPDKLQAIVAALWPGVSGDLASPPIQAFDQEDELEAPGGGRRPYQVTSSGIAVLPVLDTLVRRGSWLDAMSGLTSYDAIRAKLRTALADGAVRGVLLDVDSPGGEAGGVFDLADEIRAAAGTKPLWAIANEAAFSAAYALASAAQQLWLPRTAQVGSIGVIALFRDQSAKDAAEGLKFTAIHAGARKADFNPHFPLSQDAREVLQAEVDRIHGLFVDTVARHRGLPAEAVRATEASVLNAEQAIMARLADRIGTFDDVLAAMAEHVRPRPGFGARAKAAATTPTEATMTTDAEQPGAPSGDRQDNIIDLEAVRREAHGAGQAAAAAYAAEVVDLCALAGLPHMAGELIKAGTPIAEVRAKLQEAQRAATAASPIGHLHGPGGAASADDHGWDKAVAKAAPHRFAARKS